MAITWNSSAKPSAGGAAAKPLTVLHVVPKIAYGGMERTVFDVSTAIVASGGRSLVAAPQTPDALRLRASGAELVPYDPAPRRPFAGSPAKALAKIVRREGVDVIHARSRAGAGPGRAAAGATGAAFVTTWPRIYSDGGATADLAAGSPVIAVSDFIARHLAEDIGIGADRAVSIPRGVDAEAFSEAAVSAGRAVRLAEAWGLAEDARPLILAPGRLDAANGHEALASAAARLRAGRGDDFLVLAVGDGPDGYAEALDDLIVGVGAAGVMRVVGPTPDMAAAMKLASLVVSAATAPRPSARILVEAAAMGRPVVATGHGAAVDVVKPGESGWLVPPGDEAALADAMSAAIDMDESARAHMGNTGRAMARSRFSIGVMQAAVLEAYQAAAAARER